MSYDLPPSAAVGQRLREVAAERDAAVRRAEQAEAKLLELVEEVAELKARCSALRTKLDASERALETAWIEGRHKGMTDALNIALELNDWHEWPVSRAILTVRDKLELPTEPKPAK